MSVVVCGSLAYDNIMEFDGKFGDYILPDQIHILSVAFNVPRLRKEFGGCAGNIAYNLKLLGIEPIITATVGQDFDVYGSWLEKNGISKDAIKIIDNMYTAQCFITTDSNNNQLTSFHPGAMDEGHKNPISLTTNNIEMAIIAPDGKQSTIEHADLAAAVSGGAQEPHRRLHVADDLVIGYPAGRADPGSDVVRFAVACAVVQVGADGRVAVISEPACGLLIPLIPARQMVDEDDAGEGAWPQRPREVGVDGVSPVAAQANRLGDHSLVHIGRIHRRLLRCFFDQTTSPPRNPRPPRTISELERLQKDGCGVPDSSRLWVHRGPRSKSSAESRGSHP